MPSSLRGIVYVEHTRGAGEGNEKGKCVVRKRGRRGIFTQHQSSRRGKEAGFLRKKRKEPRARKMVKIIAKSSLTVLLPGRNNECAEFETQKISESRASDCVYTEMFRETIASGQRRHTGRCFRRWQEKKQNQNHRQCWRKDYCSGVENCRQDVPKDVLREEVVEREKPQRNDRRTSRASKKARGRRLFLSKEKDKTCHTEMCVGRLPGYSSSFLPMGRLRKVYRHTLLPHDWRGTRAEGQLHANNTQLNRMKTDYSTQSVENDTELEKKKKNLR